MEAGVHLPQVEFAGEGLSLRRLADTVDAARANGFAAVSVNDHFLFGAPGLCGLSALAGVGGWGRGRGRWRPRCRWRLPACRFRWPRRWPRWTSCLVAG